MTSLVYRAIRQGMSYGKSRTQRSHRIGKAGLVQCDDIHIAFHQDQALFPAVFGKVQRKQLIAFAEHHGIRSVQIFWLAVNP